MPTTEESTVAIKKLAAQELVLIKQCADKSVELSATRAIAATAYLEGGTLSVDGVGRRKLEFDALGDALAALRKKRSAAIGEKHASEVEALRQRVADTRRQADAILAQTKQHFDAIRTLEGCDFKAVGQSESGRLAGLALALEAKANDLERVGPPANGHLHLDGAFTNDELALAIVTDPSIGPSATEILSWIQTRATDVRDNTRPRSARISWEAGVIDQRSYLIAIPEPVAVAPPVAPVPTGGRLLSVNAALGYAAKPPHDDDAEKTA
jgi:hypothetical protein